MTHACDVQEEFPRVDGGLKREGDIVFHAYHADNQATKTVLKEDGSIQWLPGDKIDIFIGSNDKRIFTSQNAVPASEVDFNGSFTNVQWPNEPVEYWAVYPHDEVTIFDGSSVVINIPDNQTGKVGTVSNDLFASIAKTKDFDLYFYNVCGGVKFTVKQEGITSVTFKGNNNESLAGKARIGFGKDNKPIVLEVIEPESEVTLTMPDGESFQVGQWYYIMCLPCQLTNGYTITTSNKDAVDVAKRQSDKSFSIKRSTWGVLHGIDTVPLDYYMADISEYTDMFDKVVWTTDNNMIFTDYYDNGLVREHLIVYERDTVGISYSPQGFPQRVFTKDECILLGGYNNNSIKCGFIDVNGNYEVEEIKFEFDWQNYSNIIQRKSKSKKSNSDDHTIEKATTFVTRQILENLPLFAKQLKKTNPKMLSTASWINFGVTTLLYQVSDNATYLNIVDVVSDGVDLQLTVLYGGPVYTTYSMYVVLLYWNYRVWRDNYYGYKEAGWIGKEEYELFTKELYGDVSLSSSSGVFDWTGGDFELSLSYGSANFDLAQLEWIVKEKPGWVSLNSISDEPPFVASFTVGKNEGYEPRTGEIRISLLNVYNVEEDLVFNITQDTRMRVSPKTVSFSDNATQYVLVHSTDSWDIDSFPYEWLEVEKGGLSTDIDRPIYITPKDDKQYHLGMIVLKATVRGTESGEPWTYYESVTVEVDIPSPERELRDKLIQFYKDTGGDNWKENSNWCSDKPIEEWYGISKSWGLYEMYLKENNVIGHGDLSGLPFDIIKLDNNEIASLDVSNCKDLIELRCVCSKLSDISVTGCEKLHSLDLDNNILNHVDVSGLSALETLNISYNCINGVNLSGCYCLSSIGCSNNSLHSLNLSGCPHISAIVCDNNEISALVLPNDKQYEYSMISCLNNHIVMEIPESFKGIRFFQYDRLYNYYGKDENGNVVYTRNEYGWYYPGEPDKGYHGW